MGVQIVREEPTDQGSNADYVRVCTAQDPNDDTVTLATIQRVVDRSTGTLEHARKRNVRTLVLDKPMSIDAALGLASCYAERKRIPVIYADDRRA